MSKNRDGPIKVEGEGRLNFYGSKIMEQEVTNIQNPSDLKINYKLKFKLTPTTMTKIQRAIRRVDKQSKHIANEPKVFHYNIRKDRIELQTTGCPIEDAIFCCETIEHLIADDYCKQYK